ncbi:hypothetical protein [Litchfieldia alkalitelluris]|uniref:hypothetical protein n=1 Tax=Litchfieldia alkalitelluris TaxID=304268 RepID=UPI0009975F70|nr:hypothetical protein [Litchfieldia alkalitelluris]
MSPSENIYFLLIGVSVSVVIIFICLLLKKRVRWAIALTSVLVIGYVGYYVSYPTIKGNMHDDRYDQVIEYLLEKYPDKKFTIFPKHYEEGHAVGEFDVNDTETPTMGVTLRVGKEGQVTQIGTWSNGDYPIQQELWKEVQFFHGEDYTLSKKIAKITKQDEWIDGELTAFALTVDDLPAIALFNYSDEGFGLLEFKQGEREEFVYVEEADYLFVYIDERYQEEFITIQLKNGEETTLSVNQHKGQMIVKNREELN